MAGWAGGRLCCHHFGGRRASRFRRPNPAMACAAPFFLPAGMSAAVTINFLFRYCYMVLHNACASPSNLYRHALNCSLTPSHTRLPCPPCSFVVGQAFLTMVRPIAAAAHGSHPCRPPALASRAARSSEHFWCYWCVPLPMLVCLPSHATICSCAACAGASSSSCECEVQE